MELLSGHEKIITKSGISLNVGTLNQGFTTLIAFPWQQWLHERASMLRYRYIACLVLITLERESR
jgi:hypothetical protein